MIALAIMTVALVTLLGHQSVAIQMSDFSNRVSQANLLAYGKIQDLKHLLIKDSIDVFDNCDQGDFKDEGFPRFEWEVCAYPLEMGDDTSQEITDQIMSSIASTFGVNVNDVDSMTPDQLKMAGQLQQGIAAIPFFLTKLEDKVRKLRIVVKWQDLVEERSLVVETYATTLGAPKSGQAPPADGKEEQVIPSAIDL